MTNAQEMMKIVDLVKLSVRFVKVYKPYTTYAQYESTIIINNPSSKK